MQKNYYSLSNANGRRGQLRGANAALLTIVYAVLVLGATTAGSYRLYQWARHTIVDAYTFPSILTSAAPEAVAATVAKTADAAPNVLTVSREPVMAQQTAPELVPINVLLLGMDDRPDKSGLSLTDTMIVLTLDPQSSTAGMLSLPRDLWVNIPGYNTAAKLNMAHSMGERSADGDGPQLVMDTVSNFIGQPIEYYVRVNFQGFIEIVDLIGGIDIIVPRTIRDDEYPTDDYGVELFYLEQGLQHLDGETALKYARTRHSDDDYARSRRQQDVIRAVVDRVTRADMIASLLPKSWQLISTMRSSISTNIPIPVQIELATYMREAALQEIRQDVLDSRYGEERITETAGWILIPDREKVRRAVSEFFRPSLSADPTAELDPQWVRIEVLNGTGERGIAAATRDYLQQRGWKVVAIGDADRSDYSQTIVINYGVPATIVQDVGDTLRLSTAAGGLQGLSSSNPVDLRIVVGRDLLPLVQR